MLLYIALFLVVSGAAGFGYGLAAAELVGPDVDLDSND